MSKVKTVRLVRCAECRSKVPTRDAIPYGDSMMCAGCDRDLQDEDKQREQWMWDMELQSLRDKLEW